MARILFALCSAVLLGPLALAAETNNEALQALADGDHRSAEHRARNVYRHPVETLEFFGIEDDMVVVEISPGGSGWYAEILAPYVRDNGQYIAGSYDPDSDSQYQRENAKKFSDKLNAQPDFYDAVDLSVFLPPGKVDPAAAGSADMVLTFRNLHNWMRRDSQQEALEGMYRMLKPGGVLGLVEHRGDPARDQDPMATSGYVTQEYAIALAESVGFELVESSEINANPADTRDHPRGVWTLPPAFRLGEQDREKYAAIGESDRMTLLFVKPSD